MKLSFFALLFPTSVTNTHPSHLFAVPLAQQFGVYREQVLMHRSSFHVPGHTAPPREIVGFPRKNLLNVLAARDEKEHHVSREGTGWGDSVNAVVCTAAHSKVIKIQLPALLSSPPRLFVMVFCSSNEIHSHRTAKLAFSKKPLYRDLTDHPSDASRRPGSLILLRNEFCAAR